MSTFVRHPLNRANRVLWPVLFLFMVPSIASAQSSTTTARTPGTPAGSFKLENADTINMFTGNLNYSLPLLSVGGRGEAQASLGLVLEGQWDLVQTEIPNGYMSHQYSFRYPQPVALVGSMRLEISFVSTGETCGPDDLLEYRMTMTYVAPNGTEYSLRDNVVHGKPVRICSGGTHNYGRIFESTAGDFTTYVNDTDVYASCYGVPGCTNNVDGYLYFPNGTKSRVQGGQIQWTQDRNGNKLEYAYDTTWAKRLTTITDSIGRVIQISYDVNDPQPYGRCTKLVFKGFANEDRVIRYSHESDLANVLRTTQPGDQTAPVGIFYDDPNDNIFPSLSGSTPDYVKAVWLPDGRSYQFRYNVFSQLARVVLPTGGAIEYDFYDVPQAPYESPPNTGGNGVTNQVKEKRLYDSNNALLSKIKFSTPTTYTSGVIPPNRGGTVREMEVFDAAGNRKTKSRHYFYGYPTGDYGLLVPWWVGREFRTENFDVDGSTILRVTEKEWRQRVPSWCGFWPCNFNPAETAPTNSPFVVETKLTISDGNLVSKTSAVNPATGSWEFDAYNNPTDQWTYDFGVGQPGPIKKHTQSSYINYASALSGLYLLGLSSGTNVYAVASNGVETLAASTQKVFDEYGLHTYSVVSGWQNPGNTRGNSTTNRVWLNTTNTWIVTHAEFDQVGNIRKVWDPLGRASEVSFLDAFSDNVSRNTYAFPTSLTTPVPDPTGQLGSSIALSNSIVYDYSTGLVYSSTDPNGQTTGFRYNDLLDRPKQIIRAQGTALVNQTTFNYDDANRIITTTSDLNAYADNALVTKVLYDGFGRTIETRQYEGGDNYVAVQSQYDALGRAYKISNPFRPWLSESTVWTTTAFDSLGRVITVTTPDNAALTTSYGGNTVTVTDQSGRKRKSVTDGLGRLIKVYEDPDVLNYLTSYEYDVLDNLTTVTQGTQTRFFMYDSLKRIIRARNPEQDTNSAITLSDPLTGNTVWSIAYQYDDNGNLKQRTDTRGIVTTYDYDALNRNTTINYSNTAINPDITTKYDGATRGKGLAWESYAGRTEAGVTTVEHTKLHTYDELGRPTDHRQRFKIDDEWSGDYKVERSYNLADSVIAQTYPSGRTVSYGYDQAGRANSFTGNLGDGLGRTYATGITYSPFGGRTREQFGTNAPVYQKRHYNIRGQLFDVRASNVGDEWGGELGALVNHYTNLWIHGGSGPDNNGNVLMSQTIINGYYMEDRYSYDALNRLTSVAEWQNGATNTGVQTYSYDRWGNRTIVLCAPTDQPCLAVNHKEFTVNTANNRLGVPSGQSGTMSYDAAGNLTTDTYSGSAVTRVYDAENRMTSETQIGGAEVGAYNYNAFGQRVRRKVSGIETWQVYGMDGELLAEYAANAAAQNPQVEYGYRAGELLIRAEVGTDWGNAPMFTDNPLVVGATAVKADHLTELRAAVNILRGHAGLSAASWTEGITSGVSIKAGHLQELRTKLDDALVELEETPGGYCAGLGIGLPIRAVHVQELRDRIAAAWSSGSSSTISWLVTDHLGTPRIVIDQTGMAAGVKRHDYLPFGEELLAGTGGRTVAQGYTDDNMRQKFISKERDIETGLDYFGARYYTALMGRFNSVDPINLATARLYDPVRINLYSYCRNNPLKYLDPDGKDLILANNTAMERARSNIDARLRADERNNIVIVGNQVKVKDPNAVNKATATNAYKGLVEVIESRTTTVNYYGLKPGETVKLRDSVKASTGQIVSEVSYDSVIQTSGWGAYYNYEDGTTVFDVFVPASDTSTVEGMNGEEVPFPESVIFYHEVAGHPRGDFQFTIDYENAVRQDTGVPQLPRRSGNDHEGVSVRSGPELIPVQPIDSRLFENTPMMRPRP